MLGSANLVKGALLPVFMIVGDIKVLEGFLELFDRHVEGVGVFKIGLFLVISGPPGVLVVPGTGVLLGANGISELD